MCVCVHRVYVSCLNSVDATSPGARFMMGKEWNRGDLVSSKDLIHLCGQRYLLHWHLDLCGNKVWICKVIPSIPEQNQPLNLYFLHQEPNGIRTIESPELEGICMDHQVQLLGLQRLQINNPKSTNYIITFLIFGIFQVLFRYISDFWMYYLKIIENTIHLYLTFFLRNHHLLIH